MAWVTGDHNGSEATRKDLHGAKGDKHAEVASITRWQLDVRNGLQGCKADRDRDTMMEQVNDW